jgi:hypothetical protein
MNVGGLFGALTPVFFVLALGYLAQGDGLHHLCADARDLRYTSLWPCRPPTTSRPDQRRGRGTRGSGN